MYRFLAAVAVVGVLAGCSSTDAEAPPTATASTTYQEEVDSFCQDVKDSLTRDGSADPEDQGERVQELLELANELGYGARDNITAGNQLTQCKEELQNEINNIPPSPSAS